MGQIIGLDSTGAITKTSSTQLSIGASRVTLGGQQYSSDTITISTGTSGFNGLDTGTIASNSFYNIFLVKSGLTVGGVISLSSSPTGFSVYKLIGQCTTQTASSNLSGASAVAVDSSPIGHIISAMLDEPQFRAIHGSGWILADGRSTGVGASKYGALTGNTSVPDLRGMVLRGKNNGRADGSQNPAGDNALGTFENDVLQGHKHIGPVGVTGGAAVNPGANINVQYTNTGSASTQWDGTGNNVYYTDSLNSSGRGPQIGNETRMKNITVNHFIKIN